jgi:hypothetical protein
MTATSAAPLSISDQLSTSFARVLHATGPDRERGPALALYGWLVGSWDMDVTTLLGMARSILATVRSTRAGCCRAGPFKTCG